MTPPVRRARPAAEAVAASLAVGAQDYGYVLRELRRIAIIGVATLLLVVILSFVLR